MDGYSGQNYTVVCTEASISTKYTGPDSNSKVKSTFLILSQLTARSLGCTSDDENEHVYRNI